MSKVASLSIGTDSRQADRCIQQRDVKSAPVRSADRLRAQPAQDDRPSVGIILLNERNQAFVGRLWHSYVEAWHVPEGEIRRSETPRAAAFRNLREQLGIDEAEVLAESKIHSRRQCQTWFVMRFKAADEQIRIASSGLRFSDWKWTSIAEVPKLIGSLGRLVDFNVLSEFIDAIGPS